MEGATQIVEVTALESIVRGEVDLQVRTAKSYPRHIDKSIASAMALATKNEDIAGSCIFSLPRKDKSGRAIEISGPSVRLAEIIATTWGNLRVAARLIGNDGKSVTSEAVCYDLENNVAISKQCQRRTTTKEGRPYSDDMVIMTANAAASIALRNAVFACVPRALWESVYESAVDCAVGKAESMDKSRAKMLDYFAKMGVREDRILAAVERSSVTELTRSDLAELRGLGTAIKEGSLTIEDAFPDPKKQEKPRTLDDVVDNAKPLSALVEPVSQAVTTKPSVDDKPSTIDTQKACAAALDKLAGKAKKELLTKYGVDITNVAKGIIGLTESKAQELLAEAKEIAGV